MKNQIIAQIESELAKAELDKNYDNDEVENLIFSQVLELTGWQPEKTKEGHEYILGATFPERLKYVLDIVKAYEVGDKGTVKELLHEVKRLTKLELEYCNADTTPLVCQMINIPGGREKITTLVVEYVGKYGMSISEAIVAIENERNLNLNEMG